MLVLLFAAFVLPKFVQRTEPPMPEEDLAAALAAVELGEKVETEAEQEAESMPAESEEESSLRGDERLADFYVALDKEDFVASSDELVRLSSELEPDLVDQLTMEMEEAVNNMGAEKTAVAESKIALLDGVEIAEAPAEEPAVVALAEETAVPEPAKPSADPAAMVAFFSLVQSGDFDAAGAELQRLETLVEPATVNSMKTALASAKAREEEQQKSQREMAKLQQESVSKLEASVKQLAEVTKAAQAATMEASRLKTELAAAESAPEPEPVEEIPAEAIEVPDSQSVAFGFDSTFLNNPSKEVITSKVLPALKEEERLQVQLRGHADTEGPSDYNGILAQARCEVVKDFLLEGGIAASRIDIVSFGETQAASTGGTPEELRRVDIIFRSE